MSGSSTRALRSWSLTVGVMVVCLGACGTEEEEPDELPGPSRGSAVVLCADDPRAGSAVVLSADDHVAVMVNRDIGTLSVFALSYDKDGYSRDGGQAFLPTI